MLIVTILCVFLFVLFGTKNGRKLAIKAIQNQMVNVPLRVIRYNNDLSLSIPPLITKIILDFITQPIDSDNDWVHFIKQNTWKGYWIDPEVKNLKHHIEDIVPEKDVIILYIHGGGFALGNAIMYLKTYQLMINSLKSKHGINASILTVDYSLSREQKWPKATNQCFDAYKYLLHQVGVSPHKIILAGDSAGGNLVCSTLLKIQEYKSTSTVKQLPPLSIPSGVVLLSPWLDLSVEQFPENSRDILTEKFIRDLVPLYIPNWSTLNSKERQQMAREPLISPLYGDYSQIRCPFFVSYGEYELLCPSIESFISKLEDETHNVTKFYGEKQTHVWFASPLTSPSSKVFEQDSQVYIQWIADLVKN